MSQEIERTLEQSYASGVLRSPAIAIDKGVLLDASVAVASENGAYNTTYSARGTDEDGRVRDLLVDPKGELYKYVRPFRDAMAQKRIEEAKALSSRLRDEKAALTPELREEVAQLLDILAHQIAVSIAQRDE
ncbi:MAG: hypothetical protein ACYDA5_09715 [Vulcanimicrobiaceae bacterium]